MTASVDPVESSPASPPPTSAGMALERVPPPAARKPKWRNPWAKRLPALRWSIQGLYLAVVLLAGAEFYAYYRQVLSGGAITVDRPGSVEGFLPISALMGLKRLLLTGRWDDVHPAGLAIFIGALGGAVLARKAFCGWICPVGTVSRGLEWVGQKLLWSRRRRETLMPRWLDAILSTPKYLILGFFAWAVLWTMDLRAITGFMHSRYNYAVDVRMLLFFVDMSATAAWVLLGLVLLSVVVKNFWCRYLCPYGALLGLFSAASPQRIVRDPKTCIDCKLCTKACPSEIPVHRKNAVFSPECIGCMDCVAACPVQDCLTNARRARRGLSPYWVPALGLAVMLGLWAGARVTGHWRTRVPEPMLHDAYRNAEQAGHP